MNFTGFSSVSVFKGYRNLNSQKEYPSPGFTKVFLENQVKPVLSPRGRGKKEAGNPG
jgi:hypothetical protein